MLVYEAPQLIFETTHRRIFLAGSIEMGKAIDWQKRVIELIGIKPTHIRYTIFNPRRKDWDTTVEQKAEDPKLFQQVTW